MWGFKFNGKHTYNDLGLTISEREIGNPSKIKRKERVPFSNKYYDFSGIYGGQEYEERSLSYKLNVLPQNHSEVDLSSLGSEVLNWLYGVDEKSKLYDDLIPGYYFLAEVEKEIDLEQIRYYGGLTVEFTAYPFKIDELEEGNDIWDDFNFLLDYAQSTEFNVSGSKKITLYNPGTGIIKPTVNATSEFEMVKGDTTFNVPVGESKAFDFALQHGANELTIRGDGTISFHFHKELI